METEISLHLDAATTDRLDRYCAEVGVDREAAVRDFVQRRLLLEDFGHLVREIEPYARKAGLTEADILGTDP